MYILLTEDNYLSRELKRCLERDDASCVLASDTSDALEIIRSNMMSDNTFDLIFIFDILPGSAGNNLVPEVRSLETAYAVPSGRNSVIVLISSEPDCDGQSSTLRQGCDYCLSLPVDTLELVMILEITASRKSEAVPPENSSFGMQVTNQLIF